MTSYDGKAKERAAEMAATIATNIHDGCFFKSDVEVEFFNALRRAYTDGRKDALRDTGLGG